MRREWNSTNNQNNTKIMRNRKRIKAQLMRELDMLEIELAQICELSARDYGYSLVASIVMSEVDRIDSLLTEIEQEEQDEIEAYDFYICNYA